LQVYSDLGLVVT